MTEITAVGDSRNKSIKNGLGVLIMIIGLFLIYEMLAWAIDKRFSSIEEVEASQLTSKVRERQLNCLAKNIYHEAGAEPFEGKVAVAQVTINRANSDGKFPGDICKVVYQKNVFYDKVLCQFSWVCDRSGKFVPKHNDIYEESMEVAKRVLLEGFRLPSLSEALYFHADYINPGWKKQKVAKIGRHIFYK